MAITTATTPPSHPETADRRGSPATTTASPHAMTIIAANRASCASNASSSSPGISGVCPGPSARASAACTAAIEVAASAHANEPRPTIAAPEQVAARLRRGSTVRVFRIRHLPRRPISVVRATFTSQTAKTQHLPRPRVSAC